MRSINKTRFALLGMLLDGPCTGYEIKSLMARSTVYFWRESDSTIYPMLKVLAEEGKASSEIFYAGKKKKEVYSITKAGREEFKQWQASATGAETPRNEFLLKLFFVADPKEMIRLFQERLTLVENLYKEYTHIEKRLKSLPDSPKIGIRLKALRYGMAHIALEIKWLNEEIQGRGAHGKKISG